MKVQRYGKTKQNKPRFRCNACFKTFIYKQPRTKKYNEKHWFNLWVQESYSIRQLIKLSGHSKSKLILIKDYWLNQKPKTIILNTPCKYLLFDGTYFHKKGCLAIIMDAQMKKIIANSYIDKEGYHSVLPLFKKLKQKGINPKAITVDGHRKVIEALKEVWPQIIIQRCLYHIQNQGLSWLRTLPKTEAGRQLRIILSKLTSITNIKERDLFLDSFKQWEFKYKSFVKSLPNTSVAFKDLKRTVGLINNALPNMFHYLTDQNIASTTNLLESFYSRLKADFYRHRGLSEAHKINYLHWYCYLKN